MVVATEDAVLVASKDHAESIKRVVDYLKGNGADLAFQHTRVYRPWGWYQGLDRGDRYQVKCIMVKPGASCRSRATATAPSIGWWSAARSR